MPKIFGNARRASAGSDKKKLLEIADNWQSSPSGCARLSEAIRRSSADEQFAASPFRTKG
jgi:hypothetical protein